MRESVYNQVISLNGIHVKIQQLLDQFQRAYQLRCQPMPDQVKDNIQFLRGVVNQTENGDVLIACLKQHLLSMRTYKEFWCILWRSDCFLCVYTYMSTAIKGMEKDSEIDQLRRDKRQLEADLQQQASEHKAQIQVLQHKSDIRADAITTGMQGRIGDLEQAMRSIQTEVATLSRAKELLEVSLLERQARITEVDNENSLLLGQLSAMQAFIDTELAVQEHTHHVDVQLDSPNASRQSIV